MVKNNIATLDPISNIYNLIGEIALNPKLIDQSDVNIVDTDAVNHFQRLLLKTILMIYSKNEYNKHITSTDIDEFLSPYSNSYKLWHRNNGAKFLVNAKRSAKNHNFYYDYDMVKKYHYLRQYLNQGFDISKILDYRHHPSDKQIGKFRKMKISKLIDHFTNKADKVKKNYQNDSNNVQSFQIKDGISKHILKLSKSSQYGYPFLDKYYNRLFNGMHQNRLMIRSTVTGGGKTRQALKDFCSIAFTTYHDFNDHKKWISTGNPEPALFISTELNKDELQNIVLAYLTGIPSQRIAVGHFNGQQKKLLNDAVEIMRNSHFYFEYVEDFTVEDIESLIDKYVRQYNVKYIDFDYIQDTPRLMQELKQSYGNGLRSDQELVYLSKELKRMAEKYHVFIMSATQVNGYYADEDNLYKSRTEYTLRGGKSIADKVDYGVIISRMTSSDRNKFAKAPGLSNYKPNYAHFVYKNRSGASRVIVWTKFNFSTLHEKPLVVTNYNFRPLDIRPLGISYD